MGLNQTKSEAREMPFMYFNISINWSCRSHSLMRWSSIFDSHHLHNTTPGWIFPVATRTLYNYFCPQLGAAMAVCLSSLKPIMEKFNCGRCVQNWNVLYERYVKALHYLKGTSDRRASVKANSSVRIFSWDLESDCEESPALWQRD